MSIPPAVRSRLAQLLRLLLSATHPGEIVAAQGAINRTLGAIGMDLHALAALVDSGYRASEETWRDKVAYCSMLASALSEREADFIKSMLAWRGNPTAKQADWLDAIYAKLKMRAAA